MTPGKTAVVNQEQLEKWWADLAGDDARQAYIAICRLSEHPSEAISLLRSRLKPVQAAPAESIQRLLADLDSREFPKREAVPQELAKLGERAVPALQRALAGKPAAEQRQGLEQLLEGLHAVPSGVALRHLRAVEVLEKIGNSDKATGLLKTLLHGEVADLLKTLAGGLAEARLTRDAKSSLERLVGRPAVAP